MNRCTTTEKLPKWRKKYGLQLRHQAVCVPQRASTYMPCNAWLGLCSVPHRVTAAGEIVHRVQLESPNGFLLHPAMCKFVSSNQHKTKMFYCRRCGPAMNFMENARRAVSAQLSHVCHLLSQSVRVRGCHLVIWSFCTVHPSASHSRLLCRLAGVAEVATQ